MYLDHKYNIVYGILQTYILFCLNIVNEYIIMFVLRILLISLVTVCRVFKILSL